MRIGVSASVFGKGGGMERYALDIALGLSELGHDVTAFCRKAERGAGGMDALRNTVTVPSTRLLPGKFRAEWFSRRLDSLRKTAGLDAHIACCMVEHPDIAVCGGTHIGYLSAMGKTPGVFDKRKIALEKAQYRNARLSIAHSARMRDELIRLYGVAPETIRLLYPPVSTARFSPPAREERERLREGFGFRPDRKYFLFPSGGHERKGLPFLRRFFEATDLPAELVVAGRGTEEGRNVRSLGYVADLERVYRAADATVLASQYEPFGLVGVESVLCGTPVVLADNIGCGEVLAAPFYFPFRPGDGEDFRRVAGEVARLDREALPPPAASIRYDCGIGRHVEDLLACLRPA